jgi:plastocyanin
MRRRALALVLGALPVLAPGADLSVTVVDALDRPLADAVVYVAGAGAVSGTHASPATFVIDQKNKQFEPRISVVQAGTSVSFPNSDQIRHSVYSFSPAKTFTLKLYSGKPATPVVLDKPGLVVLGCNIHDKMSAWVMVVDTPDYAQTDATGHALLRNVRAGDYVLYAWYPGLDDGPVTQKLAVAGSGPGSARLHLAVRPIGEGTP